MASLKLDREFFISITRPPEIRNDDDIDRISSSLSSLDVLKRYPRLTLRSMCETMRYEIHQANYVLYRENSVCDCWYILLSGSVYINGSMYLPGMSFGKIAENTRGKRGTQCITLEQSELLVIVDFSDVSLLLPEKYFVMPPYQNANEISGEKTIVSPNNFRLSPIKQPNINYESSQNDYYDEYDSLSGISSLSRELNDSDGDEDLLQSTESLSGSQDYVRDILEKKPVERTNADLDILQEFLQRFKAFASMPQLILRDMCAVMYFAVVDKAGTIVLKDKEKLDSWSVILNGSVTVQRNGNDSFVMNAGDSFGVEPVTYDMFHDGIMLTRKDDCQFVCIEQEKYWKIISKKEENIQRIEENGVLVTVAELRLTENGSHKDWIILRATPKKLLEHLIADHSCLEETYIEDYLLTYRTFNQEASGIFSNLFEWFKDKTLHDKVVKIVIKWLEYVHEDFDRNIMLQKYLENFTKQVESQNLFGLLRQLENVIVSKAHFRTIVFDRLSKDKPPGFSVMGGKEFATGLFVSNVEPYSKADELGLKIGDQLLEINGQRLTNLPLMKAMEIINKSSHLTLNVKYCITGLKEAVNCSVTSERLNIAPGSALPYSEIARNFDQECIGSYEKSITGTVAAEVPGNPLNTGKKVSSKKSNQVITGKQSSSTKFMKAIQKLNVLAGKHSMDSSGKDSEDQDSSKRTSNVSVASPSDADSLPSRDSDSHGDQVLKIYRADQSFRYLMISKTHTVAMVVKLAVESFGLNVSLENCALFDVTVAESEFIRQRRLPDSMTDLANKISLNGRYYLRDNYTTESLLSPEAAAELVKEVNVCFLQLQSEVLAHEITLRDLELLSSICPSEYIADIFKLNKEDYFAVPNLRKFTEIANQEMFWVVTEVLSEVNVTKRMKVIKRFIKIARFCREYKNFNTLFAVLSGLSHGSVSRLKNTWDRLPSKYLKIFEDMKGLMDPSRNMSKYRNLVSSVYCPIIPFFPVVLKDLSFLHLGNESVIDGLQSASSHSDHITNSLNMSSNISMQGGIRRWGKKQPSVMNPKRLHEENLMVRRVRKYLEEAKIVTDEDQLDMMSCACEPISNPSSGLMPSQPKRRLTIASLQGSPYNGRRNSDKTEDSLPQIRRKLSEVTLIGNRKADISSQDFGSDSSEDDSIQGFHLCQHIDPSLSDVVGKAMCNDLNSGIIANPAKAVDLKSYERYPSIRRALTVDSTSTSLRSDAGVIGGNVKAVARKATIPLATDEDEASAV
ncbi:Rap guanine nucleotide exchange factor 6 [Trichoplax sp. H2]|nr:Rap guanine nucleotide exchange factor 6 [Trichoplax sp. H2]|eukprot:RDD37180.1 Rap guanine nucleotide exchange factor 6 [Trichoplax sp. H2]